MMSWLLPGALVMGAVLLVVTLRARRTDRERAALLLWGGSLVSIGLVISLAQGIIHPYYTVALAPPLGALVGIATMGLWQRRRQLGRAPRPGRRAGRDGRLELRPPRAHHATGSRPSAPSSPSWARSASSPSWPCRCCATSRSSPSRSWRRSASAPRWRHRSSRPWPRRPPRTAGRSRRSPRRRPVVRVVPGAAASRAPAGSAGPSGAAVASRVEAPGAEVSGAAVASRVGPSGPAAPAPAPAGSRAAQAPAPAGSPAVRSDGVGPAAAPAVAGS